MTSGSLGEKAEIVKGIPTVTEYAKACVQVCWFMVVQEPKIVFAKTRINSDFDNTHYQPYTKSGNKVEFVVWPALLRNEDGPFLTKGVVQCYKPDATEALTNPGDESSRSGTETEAPLVKTSLAESLGNSRSRVKKHVQNSYLEIPSNVAKSLCLNIVNDQTTSGIENQRATSTTIFPKTSVKQEIEKQAQPLQSDGNVAEGRREMASEQVILSEYPSKLVPTESELDKYNSCISENCKNKAKKILGLDLFQKCEKYMAWIRTLEK